MNLKFPSVVAVDEGHESVADSGSLEQAIGSEISYRFFPVFLQLVLLAI